ncbi:exosortase/archaeosortase family protein [Methanophagales archaeon]|nr:MAG: exosortase/archaeosortase family protein [Methanophagales archaeon]
MPQRTKTPLVLVLLISTLIILYHRTFIWLISEWLTNPYYSHGFLIPPISAFIAWLRRKEIVGVKVEEERVKSKGASLILGFGLLLLISGSLYGMNFIAALSFIPVTIALLLHLYPNKMKAVFFPFLFLFFAIPLPVERFAYLLQLFSARASSFILHSFGLHVSRRGAQLSLKNSSFFVGELCSGMQTLISLLALAALFAYFMNCSPIKKLAIFFSGVPIAILSNTLRICSIILAASFFGTNITMDFFHPASSIILFLFAFVILLVIARLLRCEVMP